MYAPTSIMLFNDSFPFDDQIIGSLTLPIPFYTQVDPKRAQRVPDGRIIPQALLNYFSKSIANKTNIFKSNVHGREVLVLLPADIYFPIAPNNFQFNSLSTFLNMQNKCS